MVLNIFLLVLGSFTFVTFGVADEVEDVDREIRDINRIDKNSLKKLERQRKENCRFKKKIQSKQGLYIPSGTYPAAVYDLPDDQHIKDGIKITEGDVTWKDDNLRNSVFLKVKYEFNGSVNKGYIKVGRVPSEKKVLNSKWRCDG